jgi:molecular chaperone GrpE (heat shock protein)
MTGPTAPRLNKAPFVAGDILLLAAAAWLVLRPGPPLDAWQSALVAGCVALGAWLGVLPFLSEHQAAVRLAEGQGLASTVDQIKELKSAAEQVAGATAQWQAVQESAGQTAQTAKEIADRIAGEARSFSEMMQKAQAAEVRNLTLQVEKLQSAEGDWLKMVVLLLDHIFALHSAGVESGQPSLIEHLTRFQNACRDVVRRVGLVPVEAAPGTPFDERLHQVPEGIKVEPGAVIARTVATGYTYQGQLLRRMLVVPEAIPAPKAAPRRPRPKRWRGNCRWKHGGPKCPFLLA